MSGIDLNTLKQSLRDFADTRDWNQFHSPKNLAMALSAEASEIIEHFQWLTVAESLEKMKDPVAKSEVTDELADVMIYCLSFANEIGVDVSQAIREKLERNESRFPISKTNAS